MKVIGTLGKASRWGALGTLKFILSHWYFVILMIIIIPTIISSIQVAKETNNPSYPFISLGIHLTNADAIIYDDVQMLKSDPASVIGMEKPSAGLWRTFVYYWKLFLLMFKFLGNIWLISFPFVTFYKLIRLRNTSEPSKNFMITLVFGITFIFIINLVLAISGIASGTIELNFEPGLNVFQKTWSIIVLTLPFHGVFSLILYLFSLI